MQISRVTFHRAHAPYFSGDVAGIPTELATILEARGVVTIERGKADFASMDRIALVAYAREHLGVTDDVPDDVSDDDLREALRNALAGKSTVLAPQSWDQLDVMDRAHLEAFAKSKCKMGEIDPTLSDDELREQIRAVADATLSGNGAPEGTPKKAGKGK